jgi:proline iminopeptidase
MDERPFESAVVGGVLPGHVGGNGAPALLLHGGPGAPDYLGGCAAELGGIFTTLRYTQRGTPPATAGPPYSVESHMNDALAVLDTFGLERVWAIGQSWGGQLALHLAVAHPERLYGVV